MKRLVWVLLLCLGVSCAAQTRCDPDRVSRAAARVLALEKELGETKVEEMDDVVPASAAGEIDEVKAALSDVSDAALVCAAPSVDATELQRHLADVLRANAPQSEKFESYGHGLRVEVSRPSNVPGVLTVRYSMNIECGVDTMLLVYEVRDGAWRERLRWQSPPLKSISDAFGDFFVWTFLRDSSPSHGRDGTWRLVVAHGTTWCTSRFSNFKIDLVSPGPDPASPRVLWHANRDYSRGDFETQLKASGDTFELRINADCFLFDSNCYERRVIYRYAVDESGRVRRVGPLALNARGFVTEWLEAPWAESRGFSDAGSAAGLQKIYEELNRNFKPDDSQFIRNSYGPVRSCAAPGMFQVEMDTTLQKIVPDKPGGDSEWLASHYFHVREVKDGYVMVSAPTEADPNCAGADLMAAGHR